MREPGAVAARSSDVPAIPLRHGRDKVLAGLTRLGPVSRSELARHTRLAPSTVSTIVGQLMESGMIEEVPLGSEARRDAGAGRPPTLIALHRKAGTVVGIDLGKRHVRVAVADLGHQRLAERDELLEVGASANQGIECAVALVQEVLQESQVRRDTVLAVGMGIPGPVQADTGELGDSTILPGWVGVRARDVMTDALGLPVHVDNDANLGALAEWSWGAAHGCTDVVYLKIATGVGAGLIVNGQPFRGAGGTAGEIGHLVIDPGGPVCRCGNRGCLEVFAGGDAVLEALRLTHGSMTLTEVIHRAHQGDPGCRRALTDAGRTVGTALAAVCNLFNPQRVVVGGELGTAGAVLLDPLRESLGRSAIRSAADDVEVVEATLGDRAEVLGAIALAMRAADPRRIRALD